MSTQMLFWFIIVGIAIIDIDHYDIYCDDDDCED